jgi:hypothetical protein
MGTHVVLSAELINVIGEVPLSKKKAVVLIIVIKKE